MAEEIEFRLPSAVPYAYVNVKGTAEELSRVNFELLASLYANSLGAFQTAEIEAAKLIVQGEAPKLLKQRERVAEAMREPCGDTDPVAEDPVSEIKEQLGATEIASAGAPWEAAPKAAGPKPWEKAKPAATINIDDFDF